jgi:hypothetical protein
MNEIYLTEEEACSYCGVNPQTLKRYIKAGYLNIKTYEDGSTNYLARELADVFELPAFKSKHLGSFGSEIVELKERDTKKSDSDSKVVTMKSSHESSQSYYSEANKRDAKKVDQLKVKVIQLENLLLERDKQIDDKCGIIEDLKQQREWLQKRVERQEEQASHDKILLLNEARTVSRLIDENSNEHLSQLKVEDSLFKRFLNFLGFQTQSNQTQPNSTSLGGKVSEDIDIEASSDGENLSKRKASND